jgi:hydroxymethylpyrimidine kinase/phosphomethylpyrimidine kinase/thiamine-phosphate diphosphorylase
MQFLPCISSTKPNLNELGIYPIVNRANDLLPLFKAGVSTVQIRVKDLTGDELFNEFKQADYFAKVFNARLFINDYWQEAIKLNAYGVHLGQEDLAEADLKAIHKAGLRLGVSTHSLEEINNVLEVNPSYIAIGTIFKTQSKSIKTPPIGLGGLAKLVPQVNCPVVAIGGINSSNIKQVIATGVSGVAMISGLTDLEQISLAFKTPATVLTIAGSDPYGGAGIQVDIKTIHALGGYALSVPTALTVQNSHTVSSSYPPPAEVFKLQLNSLEEDINIDAIKIGMLPTLEVVQELISFLQVNSFNYIVYDPVIVSTSGYKLVSNEAIDLIKNKLLPLISLLTPNLSEAKLLTAEDDDLKVAQKFYEMGLKNVLIKGGHAQNCEQAIDYLYQQNKEPIGFKAGWVKTNHTHGTGCVLSSAIATLLAQGQTLERAVAGAKEFLTNRLEKSEHLKIIYKDSKKTRKEAIYI